MPKNDRKSVDRMRRILDMAHKQDKLSLLIFTLQRCKREIRDACRQVPERPTLGSNLAKASLSSLDSAAKHLRRERGNVARALASSKPRRVHQ